MSDSILKISEVAQQLAAKSDEINLIVAYEWNKHIKVYLNKIEDAININSLRLFCIENIGPGSTIGQHEDSIFVDYGNHGVLAFYQFDKGCWLVISSSKKAYAMANLDVNQFRSGKVDFDLEEIKEQELEKLEESFSNDVVIHSNSNAKDEVLDEKLLAAQRLQLSILPDLSILGNHFKKHFSFYSPEDVLSGDFYWVSNREDALYLVVADCTGHSVEGALATMTVKALLDQTVMADTEQSIRNVYQRLKKSDAPHSGYSVGVELALCKFNFKTKEVDIVTSGVPVLHISEDGSEKVIKTKSISSPDSDELCIEKTSFTADKGHKLFLYTDGLADQFDKEDRKKLGNAGVKKLFNSLNGGFSASTFQKKLDDWRGNTLQLDDITVIALEW